MEKKPDLEWFEQVISELKDVDDVLCREGHPQPCGKINDAVELLKWAEENLTKGTLPCIASRHSTRKFRQEPIEEEKLRQVIEAGRQAPSGKNKQQNHFLVIRDQKVLEHLTELVRQEFSQMEITEENSDDIGGAIRLSKKGSYVFKYNAPCLIVVANRRNYGNRYADAACAIQNMMLAANALDLGSCWVNQLRWLKDNPAVKEYLCQLGLREEEAVYGSLSIGYADSGDGMPNRREIPIKGNEVTYIG